MNERLPYPMARYRAGIDPTDLGSLGSTAATVAAADAMPVTLDLLLLVAWDRRRSHASGHSTPAGCPSKV